MNSRRASDLPVGISLAEGLGTERGTRPSRTSSAGVRGRSSGSTSSRTSSSGCAWRSIASPRSDGSFPSISSRGPGPRSAGALRCTNPNWWNMPSRQPYNNCYNYATNYRTDTFRVAPGRQRAPGRGRCTPHSTCGAVHTAALADALIDSAGGGQRGARREGHLVALVVAPEQRLPLVPKGPKRLLVAQARGDAGDRRGQRRQADHPTRAPPTAAPTQISARSWSSCMDISRSPEWRTAPSPSSGGATNGWMSRPWAATHAPSAPRGSPPGSRRAVRGRGDFRRIRVATRGAVPRILARAGPPVPATSEHWRVRCPLRSRR